MLEKQNLDDLVNIENLTAWLDDNIPELGDAPLDVDIIHGGASNVILSLKRGGETMLLRRPPKTPPPGSEKTNMREARVLRALRDTDVPCPICYGSCDDPEVIGAPFYVMNKVEGWSAEVRNEKLVHRPPFDKMPCSYGVPFAVVGGLVTLANTDYKAIGLEDFGKPDNFLERQVDRWARQLASYKDRYNYEGRDLPGYDLTEKWLRENTPRDYRPGVIHGDIGTTNMIFGPEPPAKLRAMLDWELSTVGAPLIDLAWFTGGMRDERAPDITPTFSMHDPNLSPTRQELARYYASGTGCDISEFDYYLILARFKAGCIMEYKVAQAAAGHMSKEMGEMFSKIVLECFHQAAEHIRRFG